MPDSARESFAYRHRWLMGSIAIVVLALVAGGVWFGLHFDPIVRERVVDSLSSRFDAEVELKDLHVSLFGLRVTGGGLTLRHRGRTDVPPLLSIDKFSARADFLGLIRQPLHINRVR